MTAQRILYHNLMKDIGILINVKKIEKKYNEPFVAQGVNPI